MDVLKVQAIIIIIPNKASLFQPWKKDPHFNCRRTMVFFQPALIRFFFLHVVGDSFPSLNPGLLLQLPVSRKPYTVKTEGRLRGKASPAKQTARNKGFPSATRTKAETLIHFTDTTRAGQKHRVNNISWVNFGFWVKSDLWTIRSRQKSLRSK